MAVHTEDSVRKLAQSHLPKKGKGLVIDEIRKTSSGWEALVRVKKKGMLVGAMDFDGNGRFKEFHPLPV
jgi:hypothetical protein